MQNRIILLLLCAIVVLAAVVCTRTAADVEDVNWQVMGTLAKVQTRGDCDGKWTSGFAAETMGVFKNVEALLNAHSPTSEISRLAHLPQDEVLGSCAAEMRPCYVAAFALSEASGGAFNPRWRGVGTLDFGAIAKGFAVDLAVTECAKKEAKVALLVDLGGNLKSAKGTWRVGVKDPNGEGYAATVEMREGEAMATSATYYRGSHIYDGRTGAAVSNGVASVTVLASSAMWADGLSTVLFVLGPDEGRLFLDAKLAALGCGDVAVLWILGDRSAVVRDVACRFNLR